MSLFCFHKYKYADLAIREVTGSAVLSDIVDVSFCTKCGKIKTRNVVELIFRSSYPDIKDITDIISKIRGYKI